MKWLVEDELGDQFGPIGANIQVYFGYYKYSLSRCTIELKTSPYCKVCIQQYLNFVSRSIPSTHIGVVSGKIVLQAIFYPCLEGRNSETFPTTLIRDRSCFSLEKSKVVSA